MVVTLGDALEMALSAGVIGEDLGGNPVLNTRLREAIEFGAGDDPATDMFSREYAAPKARKPHPSAAYCRLIVVNEGGGSAGGGVRRTATHAQARQGNRASNLLKLVWDRERGHSAAALP